MTGHKGERRHHEVALVTDDFALYHRLAPFMESHGLPIVGVRPGEPPPASARVLLGGPPEDPRSVALRDDNEATFLAVRTALRSSGGLPGFRNVTFGFDPGKVIGMAVLGDGDVLIVGEERSNAGACRRAAAWASGLQAEGWEAHVGDGPPDQARDLVARLRKDLRPARVYLVREARTTPPSPTTMSRHTDAAILIARRPAA